MKVVLGKVTVKNLYISRGKKSAPGFKESKDRLTLLLGEKVSGTLKLMPLVVYHYETSRVMKGILKSRLPVIWTSNRKSWVTQQIFSEWYSKHFCHMIYLSTAISLTPGGNSTVHIYTQTIHITTQITTEQHK